MEKILSHLEKHLLEKNKNDIGWFASLENLYAISTIKGISLNLDILDKYKKIIETNNNKEITISIKLERLLKHYIKHNNKETVPLDSS